LVFLSGQIPLEPATGAVVGGGIAEQSERVLLNLQAVIEAAGGTLAGVIKTSCFLTDLNDFAVFNEVYGRFFVESPPARETVEVARLPKDALVEVSAVCRAAG
jgi:2-iminobutanoate/2-iminopropanoate deaminase